MSEKHYVYGSGIAGCLYDYGPHFCMTVEEAIADFQQMFYDVICDDELDEMSHNLEKHGRHSFKDPHEAGAHYCECAEQNGQMPEDNDNLMENESQSLSDLLDDLTLREYEALVNYMWRGQWQCSRAAIKEFRRSIGKNTSDYNAWEDE